jgi:hypothetical protein
MRGESRARATDETMIKVWVTPSKAGWSHARAHKPRKVEDGSKRQRVGLGWSG